MNIHPKKNQGIFLIEVLVTVFILASGLLGMAALQTRSLNYSHIAYLNTQANMMAYDMLDRIKSNTVFSVDGTGYTASQGSLPSSYPTNCETSDCTASQLATYDINQWKFTLNQQLPTGDGSIQMTDIPEGRHYIITVFFDDSKGTGTTRQVTIESTL